jgi:DNA polymerase III alpha subunit
MAIQTGKSLTDEKRMKHTVDSYYLKSPGEMNDDFMSVPAGAREHRRDRQALQGQARPGQDRTCQVRRPRGST